MDIILNKFKPLKKPNHHNDISNSDDSDEFFGSKANMLKPIVKLEYIDKKKEKAQFKRESENVNSQNFEENDKKEQLTSLKKNIKKEKSVMKNRHDPTTVLTKKNSEITDGKKNELHVSIKNISIKNEPVSEDEIQFPKKKKIKKEKVLTLANAETVKNTRNSNGKMMEGRLKEQEFRTEITIKQEEETDNELRKHSPKKKKHKKYEVVSNDLLPEQIKKKKEKDSSTSVTEFSLESNIKIKQEKSSIIVKHQKDKHVDSDSIGFLSLKSIIKEKNKQISIEETSLIKNSNFTIKQEPESEDELRKSRKKRKHEDNKTNEGACNTVNTSIKEQMNREILNIPSTSKPFDRVDSIANSPVKKKHKEVLKRNSVENILPEVIEKKKEKQFTSKETNDKHNNITIKREPETEHELLREKSRKQKKCKSNETNIEIVSDLLNISKIIQEDNGEMINSNYSELHRESFNRDMSAVKPKARTKLLELKVSSKKRKTVRNCDENIDGDVTEHLPDSRVEDESSDCKNMSDNETQDKMGAKLLGKKTKFKNMITPTECVNDDYFFELLSSVNIILDWEVPALHQLVKHVVRHPSLKVREEIANAGLPQKHGHFTPKEDKIIVRNWKRLCIKYNLPDCPDVFARWRNTTNATKLQNARRNAILFLSKGLPERTPVQVYNRFLHSIGTTSKGRFTVKEMELIEIFMTDKQYEGLSQLFLGGVLGRDPHSIWRYISRIKEKEKLNIDGHQPRAVWTLELCNTFIRNLLKLMNLKHNLPEDSLDLEVLKNNKIEMATWKELAKQMKMRPIQLKVHWLGKLYIQLFSKKKIYLSHLRRKLIKILHSTSYAYWQEVDWKEIAKKFENLTSLFLFKKFYEVSTLFVPKTMLTRFDDVVKDLYDKIIIKGAKLVNKKLLLLELKSDGLYFRDHK